MKSITFQCGAVLLLFACSQDTSSNTHHSADSLQNHPQDSAHTQRIESLVSRSNTIDIKHLDLYCPPTSTDQQQLILSHKAIQEAIKLSHAYEISQYESPDSLIIFNKGRSVYLRNFKLNTTKKLADYLPESKQFSDPFWSYNKAHLAWVELNPKQIKLVVYQFSDQSVRYYSIPDLDYTPHENCEEKINIETDYFDKNLLEYKPNQQSKAQILDHFTPDQLANFTLDSHVNNIYKRMHLNDDHLDKSKNLAIYGKIYAASSALIAYEIVDPNGKPLAVPAKVRQILHQDNYYLWSPTLSPDAQMLLYAEADTLSNQLVFKTFNLDNETIKTLGSIPEVNRRGLSTLLWSPSQQKFAFVDMPNNTTQWTVLYLVQPQSNEIKSYSIKVNHHCGAVCYCLPGEDFYFKDENTITYRVPSAENKNMYKDLNLN